MKKILFCLITFALTGCNTMNSNYSALTPSGGSYNRNTVCDNLRQQIEFNADKGYRATNMGSNQVQQQQLLASYQANGCDK